MLNMLTKVEGCMKGLLSVAELEGADSERDHEVFQELCDLLKKYREPT